jgi:hypothetical protein
LFSNVAGVTRANSASNGAQVVLVFGAALSGTAEARQPGLRRAGDQGDEPMVKSLGGQRDYETTSRIRLAAAINAGQLRGQVYVSDSAQ